MAADAPDLGAIPIYEDFYQNHDLYERYHIHVIGLTGKNPAEGAFKTRRNWFGTPRIMDALADPYVTVQTVGDDTGSTDYFPIGYHKFQTLKNCQTPIWDAKCILLAKKQGTEAIEFSFFDDNKGRSDTALFSLRVERSELPDTTLLSDSVWTSFSRVPDHPDYQDVTFAFRIMVTDGSDRIVTPDDYHAMYDSIAEGYSYSEQILHNDSNSVDNKALLQCWRSEPNTKAVFWVLGRNDCFMHPHAVRRLFLDHGYDLHVLNYKMNGHCRKKGWVIDPHFNSHNKQGDFDIYIEDITKSLDLIMDYKEYETMLGYAHSTGGPVLLNYVMEKGDAAFDAFVFNSPFLDWGYVGGDLVEFVLENTGFMTSLDVTDNDDKLDAATTPAELADTPLVYCGKEVVFSDWSARMWSLFYYEWGVRPLYKVPMTVGFAMGVTKVHEKLEERHKNNRVVTTRPFLCITSRGDDVLKASETLSRADWIGPRRWEIELNDNEHDVFLSYDPADTEMAIDMCIAWMKNRRLV